MKDLDKNQILEEISNHMAHILDLLEVPFSQSTEDTPRRIAKLYVNEVFANRNNYNIEEELNSKMKFFETVSDSNELIIVKDIPFYSMCEHHFMPFNGKITIGYVPNDRIVGLSKLPRVVKYFSKKPQLQERLVEEIAQYLFEALNAKAVFVLATDTVHTCVSARGIEADSNTDTLAVRGLDVDNLDNYKKDFFMRINR